MPHGHLVAHSRCSVKVGDSRRSLERLWWPSPLSHGRRSDASCIAMGSARTRLPRETMPAIQHVLSRRVYVPALPQHAGAHASGALGSSCIWQVPSEGLPCLELPPRGEEPCLPWADSSVHLLRPALHSYAQHSPKVVAISLCVSLLPSKGGTLAGGERAARVWVTWV